MRSFLLILMAWFSPLSLAAPLYRGEARKGEIELIEEVSVFENRWVKIHNDKVRFPNGKEGTFIRVGRPQNAPGNVAGAAVLAVTKDGKVLLEKTFRHPVREWVYELPRGGYEGTESLQENGARELKEETGYTCKHWKEMGNVLPDSGILDYQVALFLAHDCTRAAEATEKQEAIRLELRDWNTLENDCRTGAIRDSFTVAAVFRASNEVRKVLRKKR